jgi:hypothetical protein
MIKVSFPPENYAPGITGTVEPTGGAVANLILIKLDTTFAFF